MFFFEKKNQKAFLPTCFMLTFRKFSIIQGWIIGSESTIPSLYTSMTDGIILSKLRKWLRLSNFLKFTLFVRSRIIAKWLRLAVAHRGFFVLSAKITLHKYSQNFNARFARSLVELAQIIWLHNNQVFKVFWGAGGDFSKKPLQFFSL